MRKRFRTIISILVLISFALTNTSYGLGVTPGSNSSVTRDTMYALGQKSFAAKMGPGAIDFETFMAGDFRGEVADMPGVKFVKADYNDSPEEWSENPILQKTDLIEAFKYFRDNEAKISSDDLEIREGYFDVKKDSGELPIARIEKTNKGKYVLVIHTKFVQRWNHIREKDVWFETGFPDGSSRTVSVAWGLFYRLAKHEMADLEKSTLHTKSLGHLVSIPGIDELVVQDNEIIANSISNRYWLLNDSIWMWFLGSYCFADTTRFEDSTFTERAKWFFDGAEAQNMGLDQEFPNLKERPHQREVAIEMARLINYNFFSRENIKVPDLTVDANLIEEHKSRKSTIDEVWYASGQNEDDSYEEYRKKLSPLKPGDSVEIGRSRYERNDRDQITTYVVENLGRNITGRRHTFALDDDYNLIVVNERGDSLGMGPKTEPARAIRDVLIKFQAEKENMKGPSESGEEPVSSLSGIGEEELSKTADQFNRFLNNREELDEHMVNLFGDYIKTNPELAKHIVWYLILYADLSKDDYDSFFTFCNLNMKDSLDKGKLLDAAFFISTLIRIVDDSPAKNELKEMLKSTVDKAVQAEDYPQALIYKDFITLSQEDKIIKRFVSKVKSIIQNALEKNQVDVAGAWTSAIVGLITDTNDRALYLDLLAKMLFVKKNKTPDDNLNGYLAMGIASGIKTDEDKKIVEQFVSIESVKETLRKSYNHAIENNFYSEAGRRLYALYLLDKDMDKASLSGIMHQLYSLMVTSGEKDLSYDSVKCAQILNELYVAYTIAGNAIVEDSPKDKITEKDLGVKEKEQVAPKRSLDKESSDDKGDAVETYDPEKLKAFKEKMNSSFRPGSSMSMSLAMIQIKYAQDLPEKVVVNYLKNLGFVEKHGKWTRKTSGQIEDNNPPMGGGMNPIGLTEVAKKETAEKLIDYIRTTGLLSQVGIIIEALQDNPSHEQKLYKFLRLLKNLNLSFADLNELNDLYETVSAALKPALPPFIEGPWITKLELNNSISVNRLTGEIKFVNGASSAVDLDLDIWAARHGKTEGNILKVLQGASNVPGLNQLNDLGKEQARASAKELFKNLEDKIRAGEEIVVVTSTLLRSKETAQAFIDLVKEKTGITLEMVSDKDADEMSFGIAGNRPYEAPSKETIKILKGYDIDTTPLSEEELKIQNAFKVGVSTAKFEGGESFIDVMFRVKRLLQKLNWKYKGKTVVLVGHGTQSQAVKVLLGADLVIDKDPEGTPVIKWRKRELENGKCIKVSSISDFENMGAVGYYANGWSSLPKLDGKVLVNKETGQIKFVEEAEPILNPEFELWTLRHGASNGNMQHILQGARNEKPVNYLSAEGVEQAEMGARAIFEQLGKERIKEGNIVYIVSGLVRSRQTGEAFAALVKEKLGIDIRLKEEELANEMSFGAWGNNDRKTFMEGDDSAKIEWHRKWKDEFSAMAKPPVEIGGENFIDVILRNKALLEKFNAEHKGKTVVVFDHGTCITAKRVLLGDKTLVNKDGIINWQKANFANVELRNLTDPASMEVSPEKAGLILDELFKDTSSWRGKDWTPTMMFERTMKMAGTREVDRIALRTLFEQMELANGNSYKYQILARLYAIMDATRVFPDVSSRYTFFKELIANNPDDLMSALLINVHKAENEARWEEYINGPIRKHPTYLRNYKTLIRMGNTSASVVGDNHLARDGDIISVRDLKDSQRRWAKYKIDERGRLYCKASLLQSNYRQADHTEINLAIRDVLLYLAKRRESYKKALTPEELRIVYDQYIDITSVNKLAKWSFYQGTDFVLWNMHDRAIQSENVSAESDVVKTCEKLVMGAVGAAYILNDFMREKKDLLIDEKADKSLVTDGDVLLNDYFAKIAKNMQIPFVGEESEFVQTDAINEGTYLTVDPIDGTSNFVKMFNSELDTPALDNVTLISFVKNGTPIIGICLNHYTGELDIAINDGNIKFESHIALDVLSGLEYPGAPGRKRVEDLDSNNVLIMGSKASDPVNEQHSKETPTVQIGGLGFRIISLCNDAIQNGLVFHKKQKAGLWDLAAPYVFASLNDVEISDGNGNPLDFTKDAYFPGHGAMALKGDNLGYVPEVKDKQGAEENNMAPAMEGLVKKAPSIQSFLFDVGYTLAIKTENDPKGNVPSDAIIKGIADLINNGKHVALATAKREKAFRGWVEGKLMPLVDPTARRFFTVYGDRVTKFYQTSEEGKLEEVSRIAFPVSTDKEAILKVAEELAPELNKTLLEDESLSSGIRAIIAQYPIQAAAGDEYIQFCSESNIQIKGDRTSERAREIIKSTLEKALQEAGLSVEGLMVILDGKRGAYIKSEQANKAGAIRHLQAQLGLNYSQVVYVADQFAGKSVADLSSAETGVSCVNVGVDKQYAYSNVYNTQEEGPEGSLEFIEQIVRNVRSQQLIADKESHPLINIISEYAVKIGEEKGPGAVKELDEVKQSKIWTAVKFLHDTNIEILIPQSIQLTDDVEEAVMRINQIMKKNGKSLFVRRYRKDTLLEDLQQEKESYKRIVVTDQTANDHIDSLLQAVENVEAFKGIRVLNVNIADFTDNKQESVYQAKLLMTAILARLIEKDDAHFLDIKALLSDMLKNTFASDNINIGEFIDKMAVIEDQDTSIEEIIKRVKYFISDIRAISLIKKLEIELRAIQEFWTYA